MARPLIVLTGPTAVGKTGLSIELAGALGGEIISADSMQVYRHMNIGSAKVTREEMKGIKEEREQGIQIVPMGSGIFCPSCPCFSALKGEHDL